MKIIMMLKVFVIAVFGLLLALAPAMGSEGWAMESGHCREQMASAATAASTYDCRDCGSHFLPKPCTDRGICSTMGCATWASAGEFPVLLVPHNSAFDLPVVRLAEGVQALPPFKPPRTVS